MFAPSIDPSLAIFLKAPRAGRVKTRLGAQLGTAAAADLYTAFLADTVTVARSAPVRQLLLFHDGFAAERPPFEQLPRVLREVVAGPERPGPRTLWRAQAKGDLGARLVAAAQEIRRLQLLPTLILGSDAPDLPAEHLESALDPLRLPPSRAPDLVLGPAQDGGVWCIGLRSATVTAALLEGIPWSTAQVEEALRNRARELGLKLVLAPPWYDVDDADDLSALAARLRSGTSRAKISTERLRVLGLF